MRLIDCLCQSVMDLLRFQKFTIGHAWMSEYGNPETEKDFKNLIRLSPLHNVPNSESIDRFPAVLLLTGNHWSIFSTWLGSRFSWSLIYFVLSRSVIADHDDRVVPLHSFKLIAELQYKLGQKFCTTPIMARIDTKSGHGFGKPTDKIVSPQSYLINIARLPLIDI